MGSRTSTTRHVYRQRSPLGLAAVSAVTGVFLLLSLAWGWAASPQPLFAAWVVFALAVVWSVLVRPAVLFDLEGVTVRNVLRDVHIPWTRLTDVAFRWNLKVFVGDRGFTAWAISSQAERPSGVPGGMFAIMPGRLHREATVATEPSRTPSKVTPKVTAAMVAGLIEQAKQEYDEAVASGQLTAAPDARVMVTWVPLVIAVLLLPAIAVVALSLG